VAALRLFLAGLAACVVFLPHAPPGAGYYLAAIVYGVAVGVILPLLNALLFLSSPPPCGGSIPTWASSSWTGPIF
ncbi:MAG TPA: hypothetical protein PKV74_06375, partial [Syntrophales bacterium]|nr:hypothetical protein [Syntrophales bacterium]